MYDLISFVPTICNSYRTHQSSAHASSVTGQIIQVSRIQAEGTMVPVTSIGHRQHGSAALSTYESLVFIFFAHAWPPCSFVGNKRSGFRFLSLFMAPGLTEPVTYSPPVHGRRLLPVPASSDYYPIPNHGCFCSAVAATVRRLCHLPRVGVCTISLATAPSPVNRHDQFCSIPYWACPSSFAARLCLVVIFILSKINNPSQQMVLN